MFVEEIVGAFTGQNRRDRRRNAFLGALAGFAAGSIVGILYAPQKGEKTRQELYEAAEKALLMSVKALLKPLKKLLNTSETLLILLSKRQKSCVIPLLKQDVKLNVKPVVLPARQELLLVGQRKKPEKLLMM